MKAMALALLVACAAVEASPQPQCPPNLTIGFPDIPFGPFLRGSGATFKDAPGSLVIATKQALEELGCQYKLARMPFRRLLVDLTTDRLDIAVGMSPTQMHQQSVVFPTDARGEPENSLAVGQAAVVGIVRAADADQLNGSIPARPIAELRFGAVRGSASAAVARGITSAVTDIGSIEKGLTMLRYARIDVLVLPKGILLPPALAESPALAELDRALAVHHYFAPASPRFARLHRLFLEQFWLGICRQIRLQTGEVGDCTANHQGSALTMDRVARSN